MKKSIASKSLDNRTHTSEPAMIVETRYRVIRISDTRYVIPAAETGGLGDIDVSTPEPDVTFFWGKAALEIAKRLAPIIIDAITDSDDDGGGKKPDPKPDGNPGGNGGGSCRPSTSISVLPNGQININHIGCP